MEKYRRFKGKNILVWGLGLNDGGLSVVDFFLDQDVNLKVTDLKTESELKSALKKLGRKKEKIDFVLGEHRKEDFKWADIIIRSPAAKPGTELMDFVRTLGKEVIMDVTLFHQLKPCPSIGITGTRGKSTTTSLVYEMFKNKKKDDIFLGGNITVGALRGLDVLDENGLAVLELSSFHLEDMGLNYISPDHCIVTNVFTDHINWHGSRQEYVKAKQNIFKNQNKEGICVLNLDNETTRAFVDEVPSKAVTFSLEDKTADYYTDENLDLYENGQKSITLSKSKLEGIHNIYNMTAATALSRSLGLEWEYVEKTVREFAGVPGRQELIREINGVKFINDTTATSIEAVNAALARFGPQYQGKIVMISGGMDKGLDYSVLSSDIEKYVKSIVLLEGTASEKMYDQMKSLKVDIHKYYGDFKHAVKEAYRLAKPGDLVILAPGATSFNMFANEFDRGRQFNDIVNSL